ncbi:hypothetical protein CEXT_214461, partial [Caerostris extrusa]
SSVRRASDLWIPAIHRYSPPLCQLSYRRADGTQRLKKVHSVRRAESNQRPMDTTSVEPESRPSTYGYQQYTATVHRSANCSYRRADGSALIHA